MKADNTGKGVSGISTGTSGKGIMGLDPEEHKRAMKIRKAFDYAYSKSLPLWRFIFCSNESNNRWYQNRVDYYQNNTLSK